jgi:hypothetical protein
MNRPIITTPQIRHLLAYRYSVLGESGGLTPGRVAGPRRLPPLTAVTAFEEARNVPIAANG